MPTPSTNGFKGSRAEFADLFAVSLQGVSSNATGNGVRVAAVAQQFAQGNIEFTDSNLDLAVSGQGMFIVADGGALAYTRAGAFQLNRDGFVVNSQQQRLQAYPPLGRGGFNTGGLGDLRLQTTDSPPAATTNVEYVLNLPANATPPLWRRSIPPIRTPSTRRPRSRCSIRWARRTPARCTSKRP